METDQTNYTYDLGILTLYDSNPLKYKCDVNDNTFPTKLEEQSLHNIKKIVQAIFALKQQKDSALEAIPDEHQVIDYSQSQFQVKLPEAKTAFPRHKKIPDQKAATRWEKFAKEKGIQKVKRSRMVLDEVTDTYVPRWGPGSIRHLEKARDIIREAKPGDVPGEDPFEKTSKVKRLQKEKQKYNELRNKMEAKGMPTKGGNSIPGTIAQTARKNKDKKATTKSLQIAQASTASMGLFDKKAHKEEAPLKKKRKNTATHFGNVKEENKRNLDILDMVSKNQGSNKVAK